MNYTPLRKIILLWFVWAIVLICFQIIVVARFQPKRPDNVLFWTRTETGEADQLDKFYLINPFLNEHVAWDSEFYLSIALVGYDDPAVRTAEMVIGNYSLNNAFLPLYPMILRVIGWSLSFTGLTPISAATLAGIIIALLGTLVAAVALYYISSEDMSDIGAMRTVFYFLIFPTSFYLAQVYSEGLFVCLAFGSLALMMHGKRNKLYFWLASILAALATLTRAVGLMLTLALITQIIVDTHIDYRNNFFRDLFTAIKRSLIYALLPITAYLTWALSPLGVRYHIVEQNYFGRVALQIMPSLNQWRQAWVSILGGESYLMGNLAQTRVYYLLEFLGIALGVIASITIFRKYPAVSVFSISAFGIALFSGAPQSMIRYIMVLPAVYIFLSYIGNNQIFDRAWTLISILLLGLLATLFSFDFWVG